LKGEGERAGQKGPGSISYPARPEKSSMALFPLSGTSLLIGEQRRAWAVLLSY
jgi:hypothetical protein